MHSASLVRDGERKALVVFAFDGPASRRAAFLAIASIVPVFGADEVDLCLDSTARSRSSTNAPSPQDAAGDGSVSEDIRAAMDENVILLVRVRAGKVELGMVAYGLDDQGRPVVRPPDSFDPGSLDHFEAPWWAWEINEAIQGQNGPEVDIRDKDATREALRRAVLASGATKDLHLFEVLVTP
jgi:hypothetical protein